MVINEIYNRLENIMNKIIICLINEETSDEDNKIENAIYECEIAAIMIVLNEFDINLDIQNYINNYKEFLTNINCKNNLLKIDKILKNAQEISKKYMKSDNLKKDVNDELVGKISYNINIEVF